MTTTDDLVAMIASTTDEILRLARLGNAPTAGPDAARPIDEPAVPFVNAGVVPFVDGWWYGAKHLPAHPGRVGGHITPWSTVVHTTDMLPGEWQALLNAWTSKAGEGACAHFLIGRDADHGVVQFVPSDHNGNHAGGPGSGRYVVPGRGEVHPNLVSIGIEVHCAGGVRLIDGAWRLVENGVAHGETLPASDVIPDQHRPGRGWHVVTDYQRGVLAEILSDLDHALAPVPPGTTKRAFGETPDPYAVLPSARVATHAELDPVHRADPWPQLSGWLRDRK